jgi:hypothetical protein
MSIFSKKGARKGFGLDAVMSHPNTPVPAFDDGANKFAEIYGSSLVAANRFFLIALGAIILAIAAVLGLVVITPLKEVRPYVIEVEPATGLVHKPVEVQKITPNIAVVKAELARWVEAVYGIDPLRTTDLYKYANARSRGKAIAQFGEFRSKERTFERMQKEPNLIREAKVTSVDASQTGIAFVFLTTTERATNESPTAASIKRYRITLHYVLDPATNEADLLGNPLGVFIELFNASEEKAS